MTLRRAGVVHGEVEGPAAGARHRLHQATILVVLVVFVVVAATAARAHGLARVLGLVKQGGDTSRDVGATATARWFDLK